MIKMDTAQERMNMAMNGNTITKIFFIQNSQTYLKELKENYEQL